MIFSSTVFIFYFLPIIILVYFAFFWSKSIQNYILLIASLFFYSWGEPKYILLMITSITFNYGFGLIINKYTKKWLLWLSIAGNIGILFYFKYFNFFIRNINEAISEANQITIPNIVLPIGISFFTFQAMSYVIDVYRQSVKVQKNPFYLGLYISFFPQLVAGPIVRYSTIEEQIMNRKESLTKLSAGSCRFLVGLSKKILISNNMAIITDHIFDFQANASIPAGLAWLGAIAYTLQIYYDFSGYSDMAIGLSLMFGFKLEENFNYPYISKSISEFWRRWHISLGNWFKDYVYFPMGGSRVKNKDKMVRNLLVVWILTGIWHGAEWTFFFWGVFNFIFIFAEKLISFEKLKIPSWIKSIYCMFVVIIGWVLFRSMDLVQAGGYLANMFGFGTSTLNNSYTFMFIRENFVFILAGIVFSFPIARTVNEYIYAKRRGSWLFEWIYPIVMMVLFLICITYLVKGTYNPFIYFNF